jgi:hypothetical protein
MEKGGKNWEGKKDCLEGDLRYHRRCFPMSPSIYIIARPNGVGKTTFAREFLPNYANCRNSSTPTFSLRVWPRFRPRQRPFAPVNSCSLKLIFWHSAEPILVLNDPLRQKLLEVDWSIEEPGLCRALLLSLAVEC